MNELNSIHNDFVHGLRKDIEDLKTDNERLRALLRTVLRACDADAYGYYIYEFPQDTHDAIREALGDSE